MKTTASEARRILDLTNSRSGEEIAADVFSIDRDVIDEVTAFLEKLASGVGTPKTSAAKTYKWTVEFEVAAAWVADGYDMDDERAKEMLASDLSYAYENEVSARVIEAPDADALRIERGGARVTP